MDKKITAKNNSITNKKKWVLYVFFGLTAVSLLTPFMVFRDLLFPYVSSKAFFFRIVIELALPFYVYLLMVDPKLRPKLKAPLNLVVLAFIIINIVASFVGVNVARSLWGNFERMGGAYYLAHLVALYFYIQMLGSLGNVYLKRFLQTFVWVAVALTLNGISAKLGGPMLVQDPSLPARVSSTFGNPIFFASYLIIPMFLAGFLAVQEEKKSLKILYWAAFAFQLLGIYFSGTRGAMVGLIAGVFLGAVSYVLLNRQRKVRLYGMAAIAVFIALAGGVYAFHNKLAPGSTLYRLANLKDSNTEARLIQWKMAIEGFKERPLLGTGAENYYVISNKYYNPEIYKYDASWFDKPHNYLLEVLTTNGSLGFLAYVAMFLFALGGLWKAYRARLLGLLETCLLGAAMVIYQVQNLFVFDTVSASIAFYVFLGFIAYLWAKSTQDDQTEKVAKPVTESIGTAVLVALACVTLYGVYVTNIISMEVAKRVNYGFAYTDVNPQISANYFKSALSLPFNLDSRETASRYSDFVTHILNGNLSTTQPQFVKEQLEAATSYQRQVASKNSNDPLVWMRLSTDEMNVALINNTDLEVSLPTIEKTIALAPKRVELLQLKIQLDSYRKDWPDAVKTAEKIIRYNPYDPKLEWQLAVAYFLNEQKAEAVAAGDSALARGYKFTALQQFAWYIQYYQQKGDFQKVAPLLERAIELEPQEIGLYADLARAYAKLGDFDKARVLAEQVIKSDPSQTAAMQALIKTLK